jgi:hypothetical protein
VSLVVRVVVLSFEEGSGNTPFSGESHGLEGGQMPAASAREAPVHWVNPLAGLVKDPHETPWRPPWWEPPGDVDAAVMRRVLVGLRKL